MSRRAPGQASHVRYGLPVGVVTVERLPFANITHSAARAVLDLAAAAYSHSFESATLEPARRVPPGTMARHFDSTDPRIVSRHLGRMQRAVSEKGSTYWIIGEDGETTGSYALQAIIKTTPSKATIRQKLGLAAPNCYVNDIIVRPDDPNTSLGRQRRRYGSALLHAALSHGQYEATASAVTDVYDRAGDGSGAAFFGAAAFEYVPGSSPRPTTFNEGAREIPIPMARYRVPTIGAAAAALESQIPALMGAECDYGYIRQPL